MLSTKDWRCSSAWMTEVEIPAIQTTTQRSMTLERIASALDPGSKYGCRARFIAVWLRRGSDQLLLGMVLPLNSDGRAPWNHVRGMVLTPSIAFVACKR